MEIRDLSWNETITKRFNNPLLPRSIRGIIVGKSGCGKTTLLLNLLLRPAWLDYDNLCVFGRSLFQPEYRILKKAFEENSPKEYILRLFNPFPNKPWFLRVCSTRPFKNTVGKGEIARDEQFLLFPHCFLPFQRPFCHFHPL